MKGLNKRIYKTSQGAMVAGVCAGLGEYFGVDPTFIRLGFVILTFMGGSGILAYIVAAIVIPDKGAVDNWRPTGAERHYYDATTVDDATTVNQASNEHKADSGWQAPRRDDAVHNEPERARGGNSGQALLAYILIGIGSYMLLERYVDLRYIIYHLRPYWPVALVIAGLVLLINSTRKSQ